LANVAPPLVFVPLLVEVHDGSVLLVPAVVQRNAQRAPAAGAVGLTISPML
jgi:hypothetical protein